MLIRLSRSQEEALLRKASEHSRAESDADCEPSGYILEVHVGGSVEPEADVRFGNQRFHLGPVVIDRDT